MVAMVTTPEPTAPLHASSPAAAVAAIVNDCLLHQPNVWCSDNSSSSSSCCCCCCSAVRPSCCNTCLQ